MIKIKKVRITIMRENIMHNELLGPHIVLFCYRSLCFSYRSLCLSLPELVPQPSEPPWPEPQLVEHLLL